MITLYPTVAHTDFCTMPDLAEMTEWVKASDWSMTLDPESDSSVRGWYIRDENGVQIYAAAERM